MATKNELVGELQPQPPQMQLLSGRGALHLTWALRPHSLERVTGSLSLNLAARTSWADKSSLPNTYASHLRLESLNLLTLLPFW